MENEFQRLLGDLEMPLDRVCTIHEHFRLNDWHKVRFLAQCRVTRQQFCICLDASACRNLVANADDRAPFGKARSNCRYSASRLRSPSRPSVIFSPGKFAIGFAPLSTLMPGMIPCCFNASTKVRSSRVFCRIVSSNRITPLINSPTPAVVNKISRYQRRFSSVETTPMLFNRFSIVGELSSAARIPLPAATSFLAIDSKFLFFMGLSPYCAAEEISGCDIERE